MIRNKVISTLFSEYTDIWKYAIEACNPATSVWKAPCRILTSLCLHSVPWVPGTAGSPLLLALQCLGRHVSLLSKRNLWTPLNLLWIIQDPCSASTSVFYRDKVLSFNFPWHLINCSFFCYAFLLVAISKSMSVEKWEPQSWELHKRQF